LLAVVAEDNGKAYIIAILLLRQCPGLSIETAGDREALKGARTRVIRSWLAGLKAQGIEPYLVHLDKDFSEISSVRGVWSAVAMQI
jgi:hypothetical protein